MQRIIKRHIAEYKEYLLSDREFYGACRYAAKCCQDMHIEVYTNDKTPTNRTGGVCYVGKVTSCVLDDRGGLNLSLVIDGNYYHFDMNEIRSIWFICSRVKYWNADNDWVKQQNFEIDKYFTGWLPVPIQALTYIVE